ncbi:hypothetical protein Ddye_031624 [Dipteronia dyeriana]|uniref:Uncharacterized protein n=1 Tax=Dipteronia dyeriana TaxID=168575 RepID=A0AAD9TIQ8_9ROSI|nr:hypothetical protein Ddye_031624 [Dipteronia dyeriana]
MSPCFQDLTHLSVLSCHNLKYLFSSSTLGSFVKVQDIDIVYYFQIELKTICILHVSFPNLEEILISNMKNLEMIWRNQLTKDSMKAQHCQKLCKVNINSSKNLYVKRCGIEEIVAKEGVEDTTAKTFVFPHLTCLKLHDLQELKCFHPGIHNIKWLVLKESKLIGCDKWITYLLWSYLPLISLISWYSLFPWSKRASPTQLQFGAKRDLQPNAQHGITR